MTHSSRLSRIIRAIMLGLIERRVDTRRFLIPIDLSFLWELWRYCLKPERINYDVEKRYRRIAKYERSNEEFISMLGRDATVPDAAHVTANKKEKRKKGESCKLRIVHV